MTPPRLKFAGLALGVAAVTLGAAIAATGALAPGAVAATQTI
jgi:hypothetical protein